jgi:hypothetical protein
MIPTPTDNGQVHSEPLETIPAPPEAVIGSDGPPLMSEVAAMVAGRGKAEPAATKAVKLVKDDGAELFHDADGQNYISFLVGQGPNHVGVRQTWPLISSATANYLGQLYYRSEGRVIPTQAGKDAIATLAGQAQFEGPQRPVGLRVAAHLGKIYLDLVDPLWRAVEIDSEGWRVVDCPPVRFRRAPTMQPLPEPVGGGSIDELRQFANVESDIDFRLLVGWLLGVLRPQGPYPLLSLTGERGSGKTLLARLLRGMVDPDTAETQIGMSSQRDMAIMARNSWVCAFDNLSYIKAIHSNVLCCIATGAAFRIRKLFADTDETVIRVCRPVIVTSIDDIIMKADLLDRATPVRLRSIPPADRQTEKDILAVYEDARPRILGALLSAASYAQRHACDVLVEQLPRMADFARWVVAAEPALSWPIGSFVSAYNEKQQTAGLAILEGSVIVEPLKRLLANSPFWTQFSQSNPQTGVWVGTARVLGSALEAEATDDARKSRRWPSRPNKLTSELRQLQPNLRDIGIHMVLGERIGGQRLVFIGSDEGKLKDEVTKVRAGGGSS